MADNDNIIIELEGITKSFPGVKALKNVSLKVLEGEIHALCGENGAGKSTLIKVIAGAHSKDEGIIFFDGKEVSFKNTQEAINIGISCIYQELSIIPLLDVAHNIYLGHLPMKGKIVDYKKLYKDARELLKKLEINISPKSICGELSVGQQQMIEIARALTRNARVIIMDEPTSSLSEKETDLLFKICAQLKSQGIAIIYITHKLDEVMALSDRVTVIRDGENIVTKNTCDITQDEIVKNMIGRVLENMYFKQKAEIGKKIFEVSNLTSKGIFEDISFSVREGEIIGIFGLVGAGRSEIMKAIFGIDKYDSGEVKINDIKLRKRNTNFSIKKGIAFATEDRKKEGLMLKLSVITNMTILKLRELTVAGVIKTKAQKDVTKKYIEQLQVKTPSLKQLTVNLSGGNQQKVVLAKWLMMDPKVLIIDEPTRGIDVGSKFEIYKLLSELALKGVAIIVVSSEIEEVMGLSDNIYAVAEGRITSHFSMSENPTREEILRAAIE